MQLSDINLKVGRKCQLIDSSGTFVDGNVTEADCTSFANDRHRQLYLKLINAFPFLGMYPESINLVEDQEFYAFSGLTEDLIVPLFVGIKYASTDDDYTRMVRKAKGSLFKDSTSKDNLDKSHPYYNFETNASGEFGITLSPTPDAAVTDGLYIEYTILPDELSGDTDTPNIPELLQDVMISYMIADVWEAKRDWSNSNQAFNRALVLEENFFTNYKPTSNDKPVKYGIDKVYNPFNR